MWIACGIISVIFCATAWIMTANKNRNANWASMCSLAFVAITLLMEYRMVLNWVNKEDWTAMVLCGYVILLIFANAAVIVKNRL